MTSVKNDDSIFGMLKLGFTLALYAVISCTILAVVNNFTAPKIAKNQIEKVNKAMATFFPGEGFSFEQTTNFSAPESSAKVESLIIAKKEGKIVGGAAQVSGPTYDTATILVGMSSDGTITGVQFLKNTDSPGFGLKASDSTFKLPSGKTFYGQFTGKNAKDGFELGKNFDAISGATITSNGVANLLKTGTQTLLSYIENIKDSENAGGQNE